MTGVIQEKDCPLNLDRLTFVDSSGLTLFMKIQRHTARSGKSCLLVSPRENVRQVLRTTRLDRLFPIAPDLDSAQKMLGEAP